MWGFGLEHEVRMGFNKKIEPNIYLLKNYLERTKKNNSFKKLNIPKHRDTLLKLINNNFDLNNNFNKMNNQKNDFEIKNIEEIFNIKLRKLKEEDINLDTIYYLLEHVTILIGSQCFSIVTNCLLDNILNYYINLKPNEQKKIKLFKEINNYIENINNVKSILIKKRIYNKNNSSFVNKKISFNGRLTKLKYFKKINKNLNKIENEVENKLYEDYIKYNFFRFYTELGLETNFSLSSGNFVQEIYQLLKDMNDDNGLFWNYEPKKKFSVVENEIKNLIIDFKTYYINKVIKRLIDLNEDRKYLFPNIKKSKIFCKNVLQHDKNIKDINQIIYGYQILTFEDMENDLFTKNEIYQQIDYLLDVYIQLSNKNLNFLSYSVDNIIERGKLNNRIDSYKLNYPINTLINMYDKEAIDSDWSQGHLPQLIEYKSLNYKNVQIESVIKEVETYQKIVTEIVNDFYKGSKYDLYGGIKILERGGDKNVIFLNEDGLGRKIHKNDYFGSYHLWLTMPAKNLKTFVDEHVILGKLLQWCEPLFFVFYVNNIYEDVGSYRFLLNGYGGYGTSNPNLLKNSSTKFELCYYYDGRDKEKLIEKIKNYEFVPIRGYDCINTCIYNKNGKKIVNRNGLGARNITVDKLLKKNNCKKSFKTYIDILWEKADYKGDINMGADIRTGDNCENICWQNNFEPKLKKNWEDVIIRKTNGKFYKVYFNRKTNKLSETPPLSKSKSKSRTGIEFRVFDNMNIHYMYDVLFFIVLLFVVVTHKKTDNIPLAIDTKEWNETISNCIMKGVNQFKLEQKYVKKLCELIQIPYKNKTNMVDLFQYLIDTLHKKYGNNSLFKKMVKNYNLNIKIPNINLYYLQQNKRRKRNEFTI